MSSRIGIPQVYDTQPISNTIRRSALNPRARSLSNERRPAMFINRSSRGPPSFVGSYGPTPSNSSNSSRDRINRALDSEDRRLYGQNYENYFIGSTKIPLEQGRIPDKGEASKTEKKEAERERKDELADAIKAALGTKKRAHKYLNNVETRLLSGVIQIRTNSSYPAQLWNTHDVNAYRTKSDKVKV